MNTGCESQVLCGPFSTDELPSYQAAVIHCQAHFEPTLQRTAVQMVQFVMNVTARFGRKWARVPFGLFFKGIPSNPEKGFAGVNPMNPVSEKTFYTVRSYLMELGVLRFENGKYAIDYSLTALHLVQHDSVQKRILHENKRGGILSTVDGILEWAAGIVQRLLPKQRKQKAKPVQEAVSEPKCLENKDLPYTFHIENYNISPDKSGSMYERTREYFMKKASEVMQALHNVQAKRDALADKRMKRGTLADLCNLFEDGWRSGQKERNPALMPARLVVRDRALLKSQIVGPAREAGIDVRDFAYWTALNWDGLGATFFKKAKSYPLQPAFAWLVRCLESYTGAYHQRDGLDLSGLANPAHRVSAQALAAIADKADKAINSATESIEDLKAQLREARTENEVLRQSSGLPIDDDPVYARASKLAARKITIGSYDDVEPPRRSKLPRHRK
jgi:hypothetical protein